MEKESVRRVKQILKVQITLSIISWNTQACEIWKQGKKESYLSVGFQTLYCIKEELPCSYSQNNIGYGMAN